MHLQETPRNQAMGIRVELVHVDRSVQQHVHHHRAAWHKVNLPLEMPVEKLNTAVGAHGCLSSGFRRAGQAAPEWVDSTYTEGT